MKYEILGGGHVEATTDLGLVQALREHTQAWVPTVSIEDFMEGMAERCTIQTGAVVRTDSVANFVADLQQGGFLTPVAKL